MVASKPFIPRVLYVSSSRGNGGADRHAVELARDLQARGTARMLFACRPGLFTEQQCEAAGIETTPFSVRNSGDLDAARGLSQLLLTNGIDVVHIHARCDFVTAALARRFAWQERREQGMAGGPRVVFHMHLIRKLGEPPWLAGRFFRSNADAVIAVSATVARYLNRKHWLRAGFVRTIHNGIEMENYAVPGSERANAWRAEMRRAWNIPEDALVIGMVGRLMLKGQADLLAVAPQLMRFAPNLYIVLVGPNRKKKNRELPDQERLRAMAQRLGLGDRVVIPGISENVPAVMAALDIFAHLPIDEAFGLVLVEAMASGIPVVASAAGGCREVVNDGVNGILTPPRKRKPLIAALTILLDGAAGASRRAELSLAALRDAPEFSRERQIDHLQDLYAALCQQKRAGDAHDR